MFPSHDQERKFSSTVERMLARHAKEEQNIELIIERQEEYKKALNSMAASEHGELVIKTLIKACGVFTADQGNDAASLIRQGERRNIYLQCIRPFLTPELRNKVEN